ncbi:hypothetical protein DSO57_1031471 [Entomophthora muscae]|uniref:Uncharacterized protein n=1 Tax=Entomophthora muscae TaxID=34485 RepID=A0ACC2RRP2_9FUNG|nr:hypothetical protein DSO57_1031471 [Entomophthora muscae]
MPSQYPDIPSLKQRNSLYFQTKYGTKINLATGSEDDSPSHYDLSYENTTDYLMVAGPYPHGYFLKFQNVTSWKTSPIGLKTIEVLETLGYELNPNPSRAKSLLGFYEKMRPFNKQNGDEKYTKYFKPVEMNENNSV